MDISSFSTTVCSFLSYALWGIGQVNHPKGGQGPLTGEYSQAKTLIDGSRIPLRSRAVFVEGTVWQVFQVEVKGSHYPPGWGVSCHLDFRGRSEVLWSTGWGLIWKNVRENRRQEEGQSQRGNKVRGEKKLETVWPRGHWLGTAMAGVDFEVACYRVFLEFPYQITKNIDHSVSFRLHLI